MRPTPVETLRSVIAILSRDVRPAIVDDRHAAVMAATALDALEALVRRFDDIVPAMRDACDEVDGLLRESLPHVTAETAALMRDVLAAGRGASTDDAFLLERYESLRHLLCLVIRESWEARDDDVSVLRERIEQHLIDHARRVSVGISISPG